MDMVPNMHQMLKVRDDIVDANDLALVNVGWKEMQAERQIPI